MQPFLKKRIISHVIDDSKINYKYLKMNYHSVIQREVKSEREEQIPYINA